MKALLDDLRALGRMPDEGRIECGARRVGAEQEMFLVDGCMRPAPVAVDVPDRINDPRLTTEIARFNLEANLTPWLLGGDCFRRLERETREVVGLVRGAGARLLVFYCAGFGLQALVGSNVDRVVRQSPCPVLVARPPRPLIGTRVAPASRARFVERRREACCLNSSGPRVT